MIGGGGDSNSEYGISINDINNSGKRLSKTEGYVSQTEWSKEYFSGKILGQIVVLLACLVLPIFYLIGGTKPVIYAIAILLLSYITIVTVKRKRPFSVELFTLYK